MKEITSKQFGHACEIHIVAELMFPGRPATKMPDGWRGYDIIAETDDGLTRIRSKACGSTAGAPTGHRGRLVGVRAR